MSEAQGDRRRPRSAGAGRTVVEHWQVITALVLLAVGGIGLAVTDYVPADQGCEAEHVRTIPERLLPDLESASRESGFPVRVLAAQIDAESSWNPQAHSHAGAMGIAQFTQDTWDVWGGEGDPMDEHDAIAAQGRYMRFLREELGDLAEDEDTLTRYALAGYNAGPNAVKKAHGIPDYPETRNYVDRIMGLQAREYARTCTG